MGMTVFSDRGGGALGASAARDKQDTLATRIEASRFLAVAQLGV
jgi:hypothetical protein